MSLHTADLICYTAVFALALALIGLGLLSLAGKGPGRRTPRSRAVPLLLLGSGTALCTLARIPGSDRLLWDAVLSVPGVLLVLAGLYRLWRTR
ncbi:hypothetical protein P3T37_000617 [Kitasatospora sp. MAA4]|uniref:hypothetical protein n=1 Tax=Kitasatospora sp. MAA4 TaxID=3035093 RepID=UPI0024747577|nr:hypothetical protein [Kitasatospora sp. MAA4]MDH6131248.1 hypothetical protein [Kitasatospora sp. MAA4]